MQQTSEIYRHLQLVSFISVECQKLTPFSNILNSVLLTRYRVFIMGHRLSYLSFKFQKKKKTLDT